MARTAVVHREVVSGLNERLVLVRHAHGEIQERLAEFLQVDQVTVSSIETGRTLPSLPILVRIAERFGVGLQWLASGQGPVLVGPLDGFHYLGDAEYAEPCRIAVELMRAERGVRSFLRLDVPGLEEQYGWLFWGLEGPSVVILPGEHKRGMMLRAFASFVLAGHRVGGSVTLSPEEFGCVTERRLTLSMVHELQSKDVVRTGFEEVLTAAGLSSRERIIIQQVLSTLAAQVASHSDQPLRLQALMTLLSRRADLIDVVWHYAVRKAADRKAPQRRGSVT